MWIKNNLTQLILVLLVMPKRLNGLLVEILITQEFQKTM
jgi:hypothetical protein